MSAPDPQPSMDDSFWCPQAELSYSAVVHYAQDRFSADWKKAKTLVPGPGVVQSPAGVPRIGAGQRANPLGPRGSRTSWRRHLPGMLFLILPLFCGGCAHSKPQPVTITFMDPEWSHDRSTRSVLSEQALLEFEQQSGIQVRHLPGPETSEEQLAFVRDLLRSRGQDFDVFDIDVNWSGILENRLVDLRRRFGSELAADDPEVVASYTVNGKVVALPYHTNVGILMYRSDLLKKYGYPTPPQTWAELEKMALRMQQGERAAGDKSFQGFVWPGAPDEGLTCLGLEWQMSEGGGRIIEANRTVSVDNPGTIRAWQRAAHWIGRISPPSVTSYEEWDAINRFENSGEAAFRLGWTSDYFLIHSVRDAIDGKTGITNVPSGTAPGVGVLGGFGLGIARNSRHKAEAMSLIKFLLHKEAEMEASRASAPLPTTIDVFRLPLILKAYSRSLPADQPRGNGIVSRPSALMGRDYTNVSQAYADALHSVLTGERNAPAAAATLEKELVQMTGFPRGQPKPGS